MTPVPEAQPVLLVACPEPGCQAVTMHEHPSTVRPCALHRERP